VILDEKMYHAIQIPRYLLDYNKIVEDGIDAVELMHGSIGHLFLHDNKYEQIFSREEKVSSNINKFTAKFRRKANN
jgi:hypothetical protein